MEIITTFIVETIKVSTSFICSNICLALRLHVNIESLQKEMAKLTALKNDIKEEVETARSEGKVPNSQLTMWLNEVEEFGHQVNVITEEAASSCFHSRYQMSKRIVQKIDEVKALTCSYSSETMHYRKSPLKAVMLVDAPPLVGHKAAMKVLVEYLEDELVKRIAVWGMGGVGKTTLVQNLNNDLDSCILRQLFDVVILVTVSRNLELNKIQSQVAERLNLKFKSSESCQAMADRINSMLVMRKFLIILVDVWEEINLGDIGIPQGEKTKGKIIVTTRCFDVCREMMIDKEIKMNVLSEHEAWDLFYKSVGDVAQSKEIEPIARDIVRECNGLPLAITTIGRSMRAKARIELWKDTLCRLRKEPYSESIKMSVLTRLKLSYDLLKSKIHKLCFLYCSLYPKTYLIKTNELIQYWVADGLIKEDQTLDESFNCGVSLIESLKDYCMLEYCGNGKTVKMHGLLWDMARFISSIEQENGFFLRHDEMLGRFSKSYRRISWMNNSITKLPNQLRGCPELNVLFLQNNPFKTTPNLFLQEIHTLRVLDLSNTNITSLPSSLLQQKELRNLILEGCCSLEKLPSLGALSELRVLNLRCTRVRELPKDIGKLTKLQLLNLSCTQHLEKIEPRTILELSRLESLDLSFSSFKWGMKGNMDGRAAFEELLSLKHLSVLHVRLDTIYCHAIDFSFVKRLVSFDIRITPSCCKTNCLPLDHDEKRVILRGTTRCCKLNSLPLEHNEKRIILKGADLDRGLTELLSTASSLDLVTCGSIYGLPELIARRNIGSFSSLKRLMIGDSDWIKNIIDGEQIKGSMFPNLEHLTLELLKNMEKIFDGAIPTGGCFGKLKTIEVVRCEKLENLIPFAFIQQCQSLEKINVSSCKNMKCIIAGRVSTRALQNLKVVELKDMLRLNNICSRNLSSPCLERIKVVKCPMIVSLPLSATSALSIREIRGDLEWWNNLRWVSEDVKISLQLRFQQYPDNLMLDIEDTWVRDNSPISHRLVLFRFLFVVYINVF